MSRIIIVTNPDFDTPTQYLGSWCEKIIDFAKKQKDTLIFELSDKAVNKKGLAKLIKERDPQLVILNGHDGPDFIYGFKFNILIKCGDNEHLLKNRITHSIACDSAKVLGPKSIDIGGQAYIGYKEEFKLVHLNRVTRSEQLSDPVANFFFEPAFEVIMALIEGESVRDAYNRSQKLYNENLRTLMASNDPAYNTTVASRLYHDLTHQVCLGNQEASF